MALLLLPRCCDLTALWLPLCLAGTPGPRPCASASALMPVSLCSRLYGALGEEVLYDGSGLWGGHLFINAAVVVYH